jgi:hypothetical protein
VPERAAHRQVLVQGVVQAAHAAPPHYTQDKVDDEGFPIRERGSSSYIATFEPAVVFGGLVKAEGTRRGADYVRQLTIPGDGDAIIALRCREASSQWEAICNTAHTQTRTA